MSIGDRIKDFRKKNKMSQADFAKKIGIKQSPLSQIENGGILPSINTLKNIRRIFNISYDYLLDNYIPDEDLIIAKENTEIYKSRTDLCIKEQRIPLFEIEAIAGVFPVLSDTKSKPVDYLYIPNAPKCDGAIFATGDSMYPILKSGDIIAYKIIEDLHNDIYWGQMYILHIEVSGDVYRTVKYIQKGKTKNHFRLVSQNKYHQDKEVLISKIKSIAQVKLTIRTM